MKYELFKHFLAKDNVMIANGCVSLLLCLLVLPVDIGLHLKDTDGKYEKQIDKLAYSLCFIAIFGMIAMYSGMSLKYDLGY